MKKDNHLDPKLVSEKAVELIRKSSLLLREKCKEGRGDVCKKCKENPDLDLCQGFVLNFFREQIKKEKDEKGLFEKLLKIPFPTIKL